MTLDCFKRIGRNMDFAELTKKGWLVHDEPIKPVAAYSRAERTVSASNKRLSELTGNQPGQRFELKFNQGTITGLTCSRSELLAISEDVTVFLHLEKRFTGSTKACFTDNYGFTSDSGNRPALMQTVDCWQPEEYA